MVKVLSFLKHPMAFIAFTAVMWIVIMRFVMEWEAIPFRFGEFLPINGSLWEVLATSWPLFLVGFLYNLLLMGFTTNPPQVHQKAKMIPIEGFVTSVGAGFFEEIIYRWAMLYMWMGILWGLNYLSTWLFDVGVIESIITQWFPWLNNLMTGGMYETIFQPGAWTVGLAAIICNRKFMRGHMYQGLFGYIWSFVAGVIFFWIVFRHGIVPAVLVHFAYDMMIFIMLYVDVMMEKARGVATPQAKLYQWY